jgi:hypothetical protein
VYRKDFQKLADDRLADARALFKAGRFDAAYYSHDFNKLLRAADRAKTVEAAKKADVKLQRYWDGIVKDWSEKNRYNRSGKRGGKRTKLKT